MNIWNDNRTVMTLDAGGTNFVFSAIKNGEELIKPMEKPANSDQLDLCLKTIIEGFQQIRDQLTESPVAISFAFPGPADYRNGIIGDLANLPAFRGGIALGTMLEEHFKMPVFINNDGDLFAYGEALAGLLPDVNKALEEKGNPKHYKNLIGLTLGTGFGAGFVHNNTLIEGDNSIVAEVWNIANSISPDRNAEEGISTRAIILEYKRLTNSDEELMPKDIFDIATHKKEGDREAAISSFETFGTHLGDAIANLMMLFDGLVVIGGGLTGARSLFMPAAVKILRGKFKNQQNRLVHQLHLWDDLEDRNAFLQTTSKVIKVPFSDTSIQYDPCQKLAVGISQLGASKAIAIGAFAYALAEIDKKTQSKEAFPIQMETKAK